MYSSLIKCGCGRKERLALLGYSEGEEGGRGGEWEGRRVGGEGRGGGWEGRRVGGEVRKVEAGEEGGRGGEEGGRRGGNDTNLFPGCNKKLVR